MQHMTKHNYNVKLQIYNRFYSTFLHGFQHIQPMNSCLSSSRNCCMFQPFSDAKRAFKLMRKDLIPILANCCEHFKKPGILLYHMRYQGHEQNNLNTFSMPHDAKIRTCTQFNSILTLYRVVWNKQVCNYFCEFLISFNLPAQVYVCPYKEKQVLPCLILHKLRKLPPNGAKQAWLQEGELSCYEIPYRNHILSLIPITPRLSSTSDSPTMRICKANKDPLSKNKSTQSENI